MRPILFVRGAAVAAALFAAGFISFPSFPAAGLLTASPAVDRTLKGDRLPLAARANKFGSPDAPVGRARGKVPLGCDGAFSPISSPRLAAVFRRCAV